MTYQTRNVHDAVLASTVRALNDTRRTLVSTNVHYDTTASPTTGDVRSPVAAALTVTAANGDGTLPVALTLVNEIKTIYGIHIADTHSHDAADTTNTVAAADGTDLATAQTLANELKTDYNAHRSEAGVHPTNDAGNIVVAANATDQATLDTLINEIKVDLNGHMAAALGGHGVQLIGP